MPAEQCGAQGASCVAGRRLDPQRVETRFAVDTSVGHAIQRHASGEAEVPPAGRFAGVTGQAEDDFFRHDLDRPRNITVSFRDRLIRRSRRPAERAIETVAGHPTGVQKIEVRQIQPEGAVCLEVQQLAANQLRETRLTIGGESHQFVFS